MKKFIEKIYNNNLLSLFMTILATLSMINVILSFFHKENSFTLFFQNIFIIAFVIEYFIRFFLANNKKIFFKNNVLDTIALLPLSKFPTFASIIIFIRNLAFLKKFKRDINKFTATNNFNYMIYITTIMLVLGALGISYTEHLSFDDALWWSFVTMTTVGYGDISPQSNAGRLIAAILMIIGIGFLSMLTGTIATYFLNKKKPKTISNKILEEIKNKLEDFDDISYEEIDAIYTVLKALKNSNEKKKL